MNSRFLAQHFTVNISKFQLPRKGVKSKLSRSSCMYMALKRPTESCADSEEPLEQIKPEERMYIADAPALYLLNVSTQSWSSRHGQSFRSSTKILGIQSSINVVHIETITEIAFSLAIKPSVINKIGQFNEVYPTNIMY